MTTFNKELLIQHANMILDAINDDRITDQMVEDNEVHHEVFNTDYFIIGYYESAQWISKNFDDAFNAIEIVKEYEVENFGEMVTDINSEKIANMLSYICGEEVYYSLNMDDESTVEDLKNAINTYLLEL